MYSEGESRKRDFRKKVSGFWEKGTPFVGFAEYTLLCGKGLSYRLLITGRNDVPRFNECNLYRNLFDERETDGDIAAIRYFRPKSKIEARMMSPGFSMADMEFGTR